MADYAGWHSWLADPLVNLATGLFVLSLLVHAWVGIRDIIIDYVHGFALRFVFLTVIIATLLILAVWQFIVVTGV